jgi:hypothetical protein
MTVKGMMVSGRRARLVQAPIYELWLDPEWQGDDRYRLQPWFRWGLCQLDEVVELINKQFGLQWTRRELLQRFAIPRERGRIKFPTGAYKYDLELIWIGDTELHHTVYCINDLHYVEVWNLPTYVSSGWVRDVLWALYGTCTRAKRSWDGHKVACMEDGSLVYDMVGSATPANKTRLPSMKKTG